MSALSVSNINDIEQFGRDMLVLISVCTLHLIDLRLSLAVISFNIIEMVRIVPARICPGCNVSQQFSSAAMNCFYRSGFHFLKRVDRHQLDKSQRHKFKGRTEIKKWFGK